MGHLEDWNELFTGVRNRKSVMMKKPYIEYINTDDDVRFFSCVPVA